MFFQLSLVVALLLHQPSAPIVQVDKDVITWLLLFLWFANLNFIGS